MCIASADLDAIVKAVNELQEARSLRDNFEGPLRLDDPEEIVHILDRRIERLASRCKELGVYGPAPPADPAEAQRVLAANGRRTVS